MRDFISSKVPGPPPVAEPPIVNVGVDEWSPGRWRAQNAIVSKLAYINMLI